MRSNARTAIALSATFAAVTASSYLVVHEVRHDSTTRITAASVWASVHRDVPDSRFSMTVTDANDQNHLLGRPHQYTSSMKFTDTRVNPSEVMNATKGDVDYGGSIQVFGSHADAQAWANYLQALAKSPFFAEYVYVHGNAVVRASHYLSPAQADQYRAATDALN